MPKMTRARGLALILCALALGLVAALLPGSAQAGSPGVWTRLTNLGVDGGEPAVLRRPDGSLSVLFAYDRADGRVNLAHVRVNPDGSRGATTTVVSGWGGINDDDLGLVPAPNGGMRAIFNGGRTTESSDPYNGGYYSAVGNSAGTSWSLQSGRVLRDGWAGYGLGATTVGTTPVTSRVLNGGYYWRVGTVASGSSDLPADKYFSASGSLFNPSLTVVNGEVWTSYQQHWGGDGLYVRRLYPSLGAPMKAPGSKASDGSTDPADQDIPLVARKTGGLYTAFCTGGWLECDRISVWRAGSSSTVGVPGSAGARNVTMTQDGAGRLWIVWTFGDTQVKAVRTSATGLAFGPVRTLTAPGGDDADVVANGRADGKVDVMAWRTNYSNEALSDWYHTQVLPGLTMTANPASWNHSGSKAVSFRVTDAGVGVYGAKVESKGKACWTNSSGYCTLTFPAMTSQYFKAYGSKSGFYTAIRTLRAY